MTEELVQQAASILFLLCGSLVALLAIALLGIIVSEAWAWRRNRISEETPSKPPNLVEINRG